MKTGTTIRVFERAHSGGIVSLQFSSDGTQILSTGFDHVVRIYGLKSGKMIKEFRGHTSFVNRAIFIGNGGMVLSVSSDGSLRCWDAKTSICMHQASPNPTGSAHMVPTLLSIQSVPRRPDVYLVCFQSSCLALINSRGKVKRIGVSICLQYFNILSRCFVYSIFRTKLPIKHNLLRQFVQHKVI